MKNLLKITLIDIVTKKVFKQIIFLRKYLSNLILYLTTQNYIFKGLFSAKK